MLELQGAIKAPWLGAFTSMPGRHQLGAFWRGFSPPTPRPEAEGWGRGGVVLILAQLELKGVWHRPQLGWTVWTGSRCVPHLPPPQMLTWEGKGWNEYSPARNCVRETPDGCCPPPLHRPKLPIRPGLQVQQPGHEGWCIGVPRGF